MVKAPSTNICCDPVSLYQQTNDHLVGYLDCGLGLRRRGHWRFQVHNPWDPNSWTHGCVHSGGSDDRESAVVDNNPSSPFFGRMYVSWNDFAEGQQIRSTYSTDGGTTWPSPVNVTNTFIRDVQITGDKVTGDVYIAGMDEMGGGLSNRANEIYQLH